MRNKIDKSIRVFEENFKIAKSSFALNSSNEACGCASALIGRNEAVSKEQLMEAKRLVKNSTGIFSTIGRGNASQALMATIAVETDPQYAFERINAIYKMLDKRFINSDYLVLSAIMIYKNTTPGEYEHMAARTRHIYELIRKDHPMITGREDIVNCTLMALSGIDLEVLRERCEEYFIALKKYYRNKNKIQYIACMISIFDGDITESAAGAKNIQNHLKSLGITYDPPALPIIGAITVIVDKNDLDLVCREIRDVSDRLHKIHGMGALGAGKKFRNMIAAAIVMDAYAASSTKLVGSSVSAAIVSAIIAAETAAICAVAAASVAASSASN